MAAQAIDIPAQKKRMKDDGVNTKMVSGGAIMKDENDPHPPIQNARSPAPSGFAVSALPRSVRNPTERSNTFTEPQAKNNRSKIQNSHGVQRGHVLTANQTSYGEYCRGLRHDPVGVARWGRLTPLDPGDRRMPASGIPTGGMGDSLLVIAPPSHQRPTTKNQEQRPRAYRQPLPRSYRPPSTLDPSHRRTGAATSLGIGSTLPPPGVRRRVRSGFRRGGPSGFRRASGAGGRPRPGRRGFDWSLSHRKSLRSGIR